jgi:hypothetical protein
VADERINEIHQLREACYETDNSDLESEKTAVIAEFLAEVEMSLMKFERDLIACID